MILTCLLMFSPEFHLECELCTLMGYPSYARNRACASPSPSPFQYVMVKIVPVVQLTAHAKSSTLYGRTVVQPNFFGLMGYYYFV